MKTTPEVKAEELLAKHGALLAMATAYGRLKGHEAEVRRARRAVGAAPLSRRSCPPPVGGVWGRMTPARYGVERGAPTERAIHKRCNRQS